MPPSNATSKKSPAGKLMEIIETTTLLRDDDGNGYASLKKDDGASVIIALESPEFESWLTKKYYEKYKDLVAQQIVAATLKFSKTMAANATNLGQVFLRFGEKNGTHYIDMRNNSHEVIELTPAGWSITSSPPVAFRTTCTQRQLEIPVKGGDFLSFLEFINLDREEDKHLFLATTAVQILADIQRPILGFIGPAGSTKTSASKMIRMLLDPGVPIFNDFSPTKNDLGLIFYNNALPLFDNLSNIQKFVSDMFCTAITGAGFQTRTHYTNLDLTSLSYRRGLLFTAINLPTTAGDFLQRSVLLDFNRICASERWSELDLITRFNQRIPTILGGLLDVLCEAQRALPGPRYPGLPRLADYGRYGAAICEVLGFGADHFLEALKQNSLDHQPHTGSATMNKEPVLDAIQGLVSNQGQFSGTTSNLLEALTPYRPLNQFAATKWPDSPEKLGKALSRVRADLEETGIGFTKHASKNGTMITLEVLQSKSSSSDANTQHGHEVSESYFEDAFQAKAIGLATPTHDVYQELDDLLEVSAGDTVNPAHFQLQDTSCVEQYTAPILSSQNSWSELEECKHLQISHGSIPHCSLNREKAELEEDDCYMCDHFEPNHNQKEFDEELEAALRNL